MQKVLFSLPDHIVAQFRASIPPRKRSQVVAKLIEKELNRHAGKLYKAALAAEQDRALFSEMKEWDETLQDGLTNESW